MTKVLLVWSALLALVGCSATNISELAKALSRDPASVCASVTSVYGTVKIARTAIPNGTVSCTQDGLSVRSGTGQP